MKKIKKAVIPAAGLGTRFLPATKSVPKEMLTIVDAPIILYVVNEAVKAGIEDIILIAGRQKHSIEDFFDCSYELEDTLEKLGKLDLLNTVKRVKNMANVISIRQKSSLGLGHAILCSEPVIGKEPFAVLLGDEIMIEDSDKKTVTSQLCDLYSQQNISTVAVMKVPQEETSKYGIVEGTLQKNGTYRVQKVIEKPKNNITASCLAIPGRYVFSADIFKYLKSQSPGALGEIQLSDSMQSISQNEGLIATEFIDNTRYDAGDKLGFLQANIEVALRNPELKEKFKKYLVSLTPDKLSSF